MSLKLLRAPAEDFRELVDDPWEATYDFDHGPSSVRIAGYRSFARIEWRPAMSAGLWLPPVVDEPDFCAAVENFLRVAVAYRVVDLGGALFHSAGILADGGAWMFVGQSGAGKSTLSRLSAERGFEVLSDELNALWMGEGEVRLERMPFAGELGQSAGPRLSHRLRGVFLLRQGPTPAREPVPGTEAAVHLTAAAPFLNIDPVRSHRLLDNVVRLCDTVAVERLTFALDPGFWDILLPGS